MTERHFPGSTVAKGTLIVTGTLIPDQEIKGKPFEGHHIYADGDDGMKWEGVEAAGVSYDLSGVSVSPTVEKVDDFGEKRQIWKKDFEIKVPITLSGRPAACRIEW